MEFILFNLPSRDSSQIDLLAETAQADFSCSSQADYVREGELELQSGEVSSPARAQPQGAPAGPVVWDQCLKPCQGWDEPDMGSALLQHSTGGQWAMGPEHKQLLSPGKGGPSRAAHGSIHGAGFTAMWVTCKKTHEVTISIHRHHFKVSLLLRQTSLPSSSPWRHLLI